MNGAVDTSQAVACLVFQSESGSNTTKLTSLGLKLTSSSTLQVPCVQYLLHCNTGFSV